MGSRVSVWEKAWLGALGGRTHADVQQDPADEDTSGSSYVDVGMGKKPTLSPWGGCEGTWCPT